ncbi:MAG: hypothetical protein LBS23_00005 [Holosporaceae bacterium]|nr:hypothetical protein [Holosporaceae bacterium]
MTLSRGGASPATSSPPPPSTTRKPKHDRKVASAEPAEPSKITVPAGTGELAKMITSGFNTIKNSCELLITIRNGLGEGHKQLPELPGWDACSNPLAKLYVDQSKVVGKMVLTACTKRDDLCSRFRTFEVYELVESMTARRDTEMTDSESTGEIMLLTGRGVGELVDFLSLVTQTKNVVQSTALNCLKLVLTLLPIQKEFGCKDVVGKIKEYEALLATLKVDMEIDT